MPKVLTSTHAEDVGEGRIVEPGQELPSDADPDVVKRLEGEGKVSQTSGAEKRAKSKEE